MSGAVILVVRQGRLVRRFREAGAVDAEHAVTLPALGVRESLIESRNFDQMARRGVFVSAPGDRFYLDEAVLTELLRKQQTWGLLILGVMLVFFLLLWILGAFG